MAPKTAYRDDFFREKTGEPHNVRRKQILADHPELEQLFGADISRVPYVIVMVAVQLVLASQAKNMSWPVFLLSAWIFGGTICHSLSLMIHELSHCLVFETKDYNDYFGIFCNLGMGVPSSATFKRYHMEHHQYQGIENRDTDLPTYLEGRLVTSKLAKFIFLFFLPLSYAFRPTILMPKTPSKKEILNHVVVWSFDAVLIYFFGYQAVAYLMLTLMLGHGIHPMSGHFIGEHFVYTEGQETYSYYGPLNKIAWNVGYHNEHHDLPRVPGSRLPEVKRIAPEYYNNLASYTSWTYVLYKFVMDDTITPFSRIVRKDDKKQQ